VGKANPAKISIGGQRSSLDLASGNSLPERTEIGQNLGINGLGSGLETDLDVRIDHRLGAAIAAVFEMAGDTSSCLGIGFTIEVTLQNFHDLFT
jgi:hypothetical protein